MNKIVAASGRLIDVENPQPEDFDIRDIAAGLVSGKCERYSSRTKVPYYVAEHSVHVANLVASRMLGDHVAEYCRQLGVSKEDFVHAALLHDAAEAYLGDIVMPLKRALPDYRQIEAAFEHAIAARFKLPSFLFSHEFVKVADQDIFKCEVMEIITDPPKSYGCDLSQTETIVRYVRKEYDPGRIGWCRTDAYAKFIELATNILKIQ